MSDQEQKHPAVLIVIDGFGVAPAGEGNAIVQAKTPNFDRFIRTYPTVTLRASGEEVGLSWGDMGNSEVGHLAIGAGRVYYQMLPRINRSIGEGEFFQNAAFLKAIEHAKENKSQLHLVGLVSSGAVHAMDEHCFALLDLAKQQGLNNVFIHAILDGRDTVYNSAPDFISKLQEKITEIGVGTIATLSGRYYAMDRDSRWDRTQKAYDAMVLGIGESAEDPLRAIAASYAKEVFDEQFLPTVIQKEGRPVATIQENDAVILFNFRVDRMRQLSQAFALSELNTMKIQKFKYVFVSTMAEYLKGLPVEVAFPPTLIENTIAEVFSKQGMTQLHIAETEKYAHVTFFMNGMYETPFEGEDRQLIPSPRVASYDEKPEMSAKEITDGTLKALQESAYDFYVINFANPDMVAHTGNLEATIKAIEVVDECLGKIVEQTLARDGYVFITADHGNAEEMRNLRTGGILKEHATNPVPFIIIGKQYEGTPGLAGEIPNDDLSLMPPVGMLGDVAPTILAVLGIDQPEEMEGQPLI